MIRQLLKYLFNVSRVSLTDGLGVRSFLLSEGLNRNKGFLYRWS